MLEEGEGLGEPWSTALSPKTLEALEVVSSYDMSIEVL
jgi:hypothetical protein